MVTRKEGRRLHPHISLLQQQDISTIMISVIQEGLENQSVQELENYAVYKAEETTKSVNGCLKIAEDMREGATRTLITLHQQGEQITKTHDVAVEIDHDLSRGEKLLGSLGGMFSKTWKPKKNRPITGPVITRDASPQRRGNHLEQREKLGLNPAPKGQSSMQTPLPEPTNAFQKVELEKSSKMIRCLI
ncbi:hypothetical protein H0E87_026013 [Populus deltoides]|uniref:t-SNARE coiled-coil homology domain-containing protein n=1 Tax=Populus deltoides TaxID=3696 RepID=A0A8T2X4E6_POPDE|nr:hypothetical protein H0E87_026013 [Populus deltoides]